MESAVAAASEHNRSSIDSPSLQVVHRVEQDMSHSHSRVVCRSWQPGHAAMLAPHVKHSLHPLHAP